MSEKLLEAVEIHQLEENSANNSARKHPCRGKPETKESPAEPSNVDFRVAMV